MSNNGNPKTLVPVTGRRDVLRAGALGLAGILAFGRGPAFAQVTPKKLVFAYAIPVGPSALAFDAFAKEVNARSKGELDVQFFGATLITKELEVMNAVKSGNIAIGGASGAAATVFPDMGIFLVPYLVKSYDQAYKMLNGAIGDKLDRDIQEKHKLKVLLFYDYGFRHFWTTKRPIVEPKDLRGLKIRVQPAKVFSDTINGLGGNAVPMAFGEMFSAAKQGVIDGGDLPIVNQLSLKIWEVSTYCSMTFHNYGPTLIVMNLEVWNGLTAAQQKLILDASREAQEKIRKATESVDNFAKAKELLGSHGMKVVQSDVEAFRKVAQEKIWPAYKQQFGALWDQVASAKV
jgi:tripartite ATP-independent transporter DctP family solute receptor